MIVAFPATSFGAIEKTSTAPEENSFATEENVVADELLILTEENTSRNELRTIAEDAGADLDEVSVLDDGTKLASISLDGSSDVKIVADEIAEEDSVLLVQPNYLYSLCEEEAVTDDIRIIVDDTIRVGKPISQWNMTSRYAGATRASDALGSLSQEGERVTVAVIDTGVKLDHPEIKDCVLTDKCVTFNGGKKGTFKSWDGSDDDDGHGTHVCGSIAAKTNDGIGISGSSADRADLMVIDAARKNTLSFSTQDLALAIDHAVKNGADIINISVGGLFRDQIIENVVDSAFEKDVLCVCAAGNNNTSLFITPGDSSGAINVMAHDRNGVKASFSNYGPERDVSAPGVDIVSSYVSKNNEHADYAIYATKSGTSMAAPQVSGLAALLKSEDTRLTARELKNLIYTSGGTGGFSSFGFGRIDAVNAISNLNGDSNPTGIVLNRNSRSMYPGESFTLEYAVYPGTASRYADEVAFTSSNTSVAKVDGKGNVKAISAGTATITAQCGGIKASCTVKVSKIPYVQIKKLPYVKNGTFSPTDPTLKPNVGNMVLEAMMDVYRLPATKVGKTVSIIVGSKAAIPTVKVFDPKGKEIKLTLTSGGGTGGKDYTVKAKYVPKISGRYRVQIIGRNGGSGTVNKQYSLTIKGISTEVKKKAANPIKVKAKSVTVKYSKVKKKAVTLKRSKVMTVKKAKGKVTYTKLSGTSTIKVNKKTGKVTIKKKAAKGKYRITVKVHAAGNSKYKSANRYVKLTIKVK